MGGRPWHLERQAVTRFQIVRLVAVAVAASRAERRAMTIERECVAIHRAILMKDRVGDVLSARVSGVTVTYLTSPPSEFAPYSVPCGPRSTSTRARSNGSRSGARIAPLARLVADPNGASSI